MSKSSKSSKLLNSKPLSINIILDDKQGEDLSQWIKECIHGEIIGLVRDEVNQLKEEVKDEAIRKFNECFTRSSILGMLSNACREKAREIYNSYGDNIKFEKIIDDRYKYLYSDNELEKKFDKFICKIISEKIDNLNVLKEVYEK